MFVAINAQNGTIEGQENPLANIDSMKFYEVQKYMTLTGHAYHTYAAVMNKDAWESLPADLQKVMCARQQRRKKVPEGGWQWWGAGQGAVCRDVVRVVRVW